MFVPRTTTTTSLTGRSHSVPAASIRHVASPQYVEQHRAVVERQRQLHSDDRALWHLEREELHATIRGLEAEVGKLKRRLEHDRSLSPPAKSYPTPSDSKNPFNISPPMDKTHSLQSLHPRASSDTSSGLKVWMGSAGQTDIPVTRSFSDSAHHPPTIGIRPLGQIIEEQSPKVRRPSVTCNVRKPLSPPEHVAPGTLIAGDQVDKDLDGITFKAAGLPPAIVQSVLTPNSSSSPSRRSPSPTRSPPRSLNAAAVAATSAEPLQISRATLAADAFMTRDAGHTPLARITDAASVASSVGTPTQASLPLPLREPPPFEPNPTAVPTRPPNVRSIDYLPTDRQREPETEADEALKGPLALPSEATGEASHAFLRQLDSKLREAVESNSTPSVTVPAPSLLVPAQPAAEGADPNSTAPAAATEESVPPLRIRRSMNFGTAFGAKTIGNGTS